MSVELLREAAEAMRDAWLVPAQEGAVRRLRGQRVGTMAETMLKVARWLECEASVQEMYPDRDDDDITNALAVARTYLGSDA